MYATVAPLLDRQRLAFGEYRHDPAFLIDDGLTHLGRTRDCFRIVGPRLLTDIVATVQFHDQSAPLTCGGWGRLTLVGVNPAHRHTRNAQLHHRLA